MIHFNKIIKGIKVRARQDDADAAVISWEAEVRASASSGFTYEIPYTVNSRSSWTAKEEKSKKEKDKEIEQLQQKVINVILLDQDSAKC